MHVKSPSASPREDEGYAPGPQLSHCSSAPVIPSCRARQEVGPYSGGHVSWLAEPPKKSEKSGLKYQRSGNVPKPGVCPCQGGQQQGKKGDRELVGLREMSQRSADLACALLAKA